VFLVILLRYTFVVQTRKLVMYQFQFFEPCLPVDRDNGPKTRRFTKRFIRVTSCLWVFVVQTR